MILVIGGVNQGKLNYVEQWLVKGQYANGVVDSYDKAFKCPIVYGFHEYIRRILEENSDQTKEIKQDIVLEFIQNILIHNPKTVIVMNEIGYGIVPMNPDDRLYREVVGQAGQVLAKEASEVHRIVCGLGTRIK